MNQLIVASLEEDSTIHLANFPKELMIGFEADIVDWIIEYSSKHGTTPAIERLTGDFPFFIPIALPKTSKPIPLSDLAEQTLERRMKEYTIMSLQEATRVAKDGEDVYEIIDSIYRVRAMATGVHRFSTYDRSEYFREPGLELGLKVIDNATGGIGKGEVVVIAGRLGTGKTSVSLFFAYNWWKLGKRVLFISNEMLPGDIYSRMDGIVGKFNPLLIRTAKRDDVMTLVAKSREIAGEMEHSTGGELFVPSTRNMTPTQVFSLAKNISADAVIIDGLYLMNLEGFHSGSKWERVGAVSNQVKQFALEMRIPTAALTQIKRGAGSGGSYDPEDLSYADAIGQDADMVLAIKPSKAIGGRMELELIKNRFGPNAATIVSIDYETMTLTDESVMTVPADGEFFSPRTELPEEVKPKRRRKDKAVESPPKLMGGGIFVSTTPDEKSADEVPWFGEEDLEFMTE